MGSFVEDVFSFSAIIIAISMSYGTVRTVVCGMLHHFIFTLLYYKPDLALV